MAYSVQQRTQEIGIRMALGASPENVRKMVVRQGMMLAGIGVVIGVAAALGLMRFMAGLIYGVKTWDPVVFVSVTGAAERGIVVGDVRSGTASVARGSDGFAAVRMKHSPGPCSFTFETFEISDVVFTHFRAFALQ